MKLFKWDELPTNLDELSDRELFKLKNWLENEATWYEVVSTSKFEECKERLTEVDEVLTGRDDFRRDFRLFETDVKKGDAW